MNTEEYEGLIMAVRNVENECDKIAEIIRKLYPSTCLNARIYFDKKIISEKVSQLRRDIYFAKGVEL